jgi:hypothetical protein
MTDDNIILHLSQESQKRQLFLKKIKLNDFPDLKNVYNDYFNNRINFFNSKIKNKYIFIGKIHYKEKDDLNSTVKTYKVKNKKNLLNNSKISGSRITFEETSHGDKKHVGAKFGKNTSLKIGQHYIDDFELENLFQKFKTVQKINKSKTSRFITVKDLMEKKEKNNSNANNKKIEKKHKNENEYNKTMSTWLTNHNAKNENLFLNECNSAKNLYNKNNKLSNFPILSKINSTNDIIDEYINNDKREKQNFKTMNNFFESFEKAKNINKKIRTRNKMINRQNQFLLNIKDSKNNINQTDHKYIAQILANQEQTLLKSSKSQAVFNHLGDKLSRKINKSKKDLLILNSDNFRIRQELKNRIDEMNKHIGPEHFYNWIKDLRTISSINSTLPIQVDRIRNPMKKEKYLFFKNNIQLKDFKKIINNINRDTYNCQGLFIQGQDLLQLEYDYVKSLKNKKIINSIESYLPSSEVEDKYFAGKTKFTK